MSKNRPGVRSSSTARRTTSQTGGWYRHSSITTGGGADVSRFGSPSPIRVWPNQKGRKTPPPAVWPCGFFPGLRALEGNGGQAPEEFIQGAINCAVEVGVPLHTVYATENTLATLPFSHVLPY